MLTRKRGESKSQFGFIFIFHMIIYVLYLVFGVTIDGFLIQSVEAVAR